jgi:hypothetical protein
MAGLVKEIGITVNAVLIVFVAAFTVRHAIRRQTAIHHRWAPR